MISPSTAPMIPIVGANPPADSNTFASCSARASATSLSSSIIDRISSRSAPSTASSNAFRKYGSLALIASCSRLTSPFLRAITA